MTQPAGGRRGGGAMRLLVEGEQHLAAGLRNGLEADGLAVEAGRRSSCPTAKGASGTKGEGLNNGADDHLTKPFPTAGSPGSGRCRIEASQRGRPCWRLVLSAGIGRPGGRRKWEVDRPADG